MNKKKVIIISIILVISLTIVLILTRPNLRKLLGSVNLMNLQASDVPYINNSQSNVQGAIDDLYTKVSNMECKEGYTKGETTSNGGYECLIPSPSFETSSWDDIINGYNSGNISQLQADMIAGTTRNVDLGSLGVHPVRIANLTPCSEVEVESETACGLVIEFADVITTQKMNQNENSSEDGDGNTGGWEQSIMRAFVNGKYYARYDLDYTTTGVYSKLPAELKSKIIDTTVVSGYGVNYTTNFVTTDKVYLLSTHEVYEDIDNNPSKGISADDKGYNETRQLDYYRENDVNNSNNYSAAIKKDRISSKEWWLRSAYSKDYALFYSVSKDGFCGATGAKSSIGVSPAFRLAN